MKIIECRGYELEKAKPNTSEDLFNRSEITYTDGGKEKTLHVLYVRYFDQIFNEFTPYQEDPLFAVGERDIYFKDIVALVCLLKKPELCQHKRLYINDQAEFAGYFQDINFDQLPEIFRSIIETGGYELKDGSKYMMQPN